MCHVAHSDVMVWCCTDCIAHHAVNRHEQPLLGSGALRQPKYVLCKAQEADATQTHTLARRLGTLVQPWVFGVESSMHSWERGVCCTIAPHLQGERLVLICYVCMCRELGESNAVTVRRPRLKRQTFEAAAARYMEKFGEDGSLPATYQV